MPLHRGHSFGQEVMDWRAYTVCSSCVGFSVLPKPTQTCSPDFYTLITLDPQARLSCLLTRVLPAGTLFIWIFTLKTQTQATPLTKPPWDARLEPCSSDKNKTPGTQRHVSF